MTDHRLSHTESDANRNMPLGETRRQLSLLEQLWTAKSWLTMNKASMVRLEETVLKAREELAKAQTTYDDLFRKVGSNALGAVCQEFGNLATPIDTRVPLRQSPACPLPIPEKAPTIGLCAPNQIDYP